MRLCLEVLKIEFGSYGIRDFEIYAFVRYKKIIAKTVHMFIKEYGIIFLK